MGKNDKRDSLKIPDKAIRIIEKYRTIQRSKDDLIFPELKNVDTSNDFITRRKIAFKTSAIDKILKNSVAPAAKIEKRLTSHIARHSFGQNPVEIDVRILQRLFRHTKLETTIGYMGNFKHSATDDALNAVLGI
jgi:integrase/recombinase XerD